MSTFDAPPMADVDLRGFTHALEPLHRRSEWELDALKARLLRAANALAATEADLECLVARHAAQAERLVKAPAVRIDPFAHRAALHFLADLRAQSNELTARRDVQRTEREVLAAACAAQQVRLDGLRKQRAEALVIHAGELRRRRQVEQDRDWLARRPDPMTGSLR